MALFDSLGVFGFLADFKGFVGRIGDLRHVAVL
jgi:hypothetical protein